MNAQRLVSHQRGRVALESFKVSRPRGGQLLVRALFTLVSPGTERAFLLGLPNAERPFPQRFGYNMVGKVLVVGGGVGGFARGEQVVCEGNHASHWLAASARTLKLPQGLAPEHAVFFNMLSIALQGVRKARVELGDRVLVIGAGLVGQLAAQCARLQGGFPVIVADVSARRLAVAKRCGADFVLRADAADFSLRLRDATHGLGPSVVIEATGAPEPVNTAFALAGRFGRVVLLASTRGETERVNFYRDVHLKGLTVLGAHAFVRPERDSTAAFWSWKDDGELVLRLLEAGRFVLAPLVTHRIKARAAANFYNERLLRWSDEVIGVLMDWR